MNSKGQALVVLIIIIPVLLLLMAFLIDNLIIGYEKVHLNSVVKEVIRENINSSDKDQIINDLRENDIDDDININTQDGLEISFSHETESFFGKLIKKDKYQINIDIKGSLKDGKIKYEKGQTQ